MDDAIGAMLWCFEAFFFFLVPYNNDGAMLWVLCGGASAVWRCCSYAAVLQLCSRAFSVWLH